MKQGKGCTEVMPRARLSRASNADRELDFLKWLIEQVGARHSGRQRTHEAA